jgi:hypothetical protein
MLNKKDSHTPPTTCLSATDPPLGSLATRTAVCRDDKQITAIDALTHQ